MKKLLDKILKAKRTNTILYEINNIAYDAENILNTYEKIILKEMDKMCVESLSPDAFDKWEDVKSGLKLARKNLK